MKNHHITKWAGIFVLLALSFNNVQGQTIEQEKKLIIGTWITEDSTWSLEFGTDSKCKEYYDGKLAKQYSYKITSVNSPCGRKMQTDPRETDATFLQLNDLKTNVLECFEINGVSKTEMSITGYVVPTLFIRKATINPSALKSSPTQKKH